MEQFTIMDILLPILVSLVIGRFIGLEREYKVRSADGDVYILITMGACLASMLSRYDNFMLHTGWASIVDQVGFKLDGTRYATQVVSGVGFLCAGSIYIAGLHRVSGLTTAAVIFAAAMIGLICGAGDVAMAVVAFVLVMLYLTLGKYLDKLIRLQMGSVVIELYGPAPIYAGKVMQVLSEKQVTVFDWSKEEENGKGRMTISIRINRKKARRMEVICALVDLPGIENVHQLSI